MVVEFLSLFQLACYIFKLPNFFSLGFVNYRLDFVALPTTFLKWIKYSGFLSHIKFIELLIQSVARNLFQRKCSSVSDQEWLDGFQLSRIIFFWYMKFHSFTTLCLPLLDFFSVLWNSIVLWQTWDGWISKSPWIYHTDNK